MVAAGASPGAGNTELPGLHGRPPALTQQRRDSAAEEK